MCKQRSSLAEAQSQQGTGCKLPSLQKGLAPWVSLKSQHVHIAWGTIGEIATVHTRLLSINVSSFTLEGYKSALSAFLVGLHTSAVAPSVSIY